jgi:hypothetical protein
MPFKKDNVEKKNGKNRQATDDNIIRRMRGACRTTNPRIQTLRTRNTYCFSTVQRLQEIASVLRLHVHSLFCYYMTLHYASHNLF